MTHEEALACLIRDHHLSVGDAWSLNLYWRKLILGYTVPERELSPAEIEAEQRKTHEAMMARMQFNRPRAGKGGWA